MKESAQLQSEIVNERAAWEAERRGLLLKVSALEAEVTKLGGDPETVTTGEETTDAGVAEPEVSAGAGESGAEGGADVPPAEDPGAGGDPHGEQADPKAGKRAAKQGRH